MIEWIFADGLTSYFYLVCSLVDEINNVCSYNYNHVDDDDDDDDDG